MLVIIGIVGFIGSGKGTVSEYLTERYKFNHDSFASSLKDACAVIFDWPRDLLEGDTTESRSWREEVDTWWAKELNIPNFSPRYALQLIGTDSLRNHFNQNLWFLTLANRVRKNPEKNIVISDVRFPNEINFIRQNKGYLFRVIRGKNPVWFETAYLANQGDESALDTMITTYSSVHFSEWAWIGKDVDYTVDNNGSFDNLITNIDSIMNKIQS